jgi:hypothetical protein
MSYAKADRPTNPQAFYTDRQLRERWQCSHMKLKRLRERGLLKSFKAGGTGWNLTSVAEVARLEGGSDDDEAA